MPTFSVLLVLKNRSAHTRRLMNIWETEQFPYKILIADGGNDKDLEDTLSDKSNFPHVNYEYIKYPFDNNLQQFYAKMSDAVMRIDTDTVSVMDNDDDLSIEGIEKCLEILEDDSYSSARGLMSDTRGRNMYKQFPDSIMGNSATERMINQTKHFHGNWHNITRTNHIQAEWRSIEVVSPNNFRIVEQITGYLNAIWGNGYRGDFEWMSHGASERIQTNAGNLQSHFPPQEQWIRSDYWLEEFNKLTEVIGTAIAYKDRVNVNKAMDDFKNIYPFKVPALMELLHSRICEATKLGYDNDRIKKMYAIMHECSV